MRYTTIEHRHAMLDVYTSWIVASNMLLQNSRAAFYYSDVFSNNAANVDFLKYNSPTCHDPMSAPDERRMYVN